jgi:hypothetical protein
VGSRGEGRGSKLKTGQYFVKKRKRIKQLENAICRAIRWIDASKIIKSDIVMTKIILSNALGSKKFNQLDRKIRRKEKK